MEEFEIESGDLFNIKAQEEDFDLPEEHVYDLLDLTSPSIFFILVIFNSPRKRGRGRLKRGLSTKK